MLVLDQLCLSGILLSLSRPCQGSSYTFYTSYTASLYTQQDILHIYTKIRVNHTNFCLSIVHQQIWYKGGGNTLLGGRQVLVSNAYYTRPQIIHNYTMYNRRSCKTTHFACMHIIHIIHNYASNVIHIRYTARH